MNQIAGSPVGVADVSIGRRWRALFFPSVLVALAFAFAMFDTFTSLIDLWWHSAGYGHGLVVLGVCVYLLYLRQQQFAAVPIRPSVLGLLVTCGLVAAWFVSRALSVLIGEQVALVLIALSLVTALYGTRVAKVAASPILYVFCAIPIWSYLTPLLQDSTAQASTQMSRTLGVPIYLEGIYMTIPDGVFLVAEVCAGISYLLAAMALGGFYALLNLRGFWTRAAMLLLAVAAGVLFNWIRVTSIVLIGHHSKMQSSIVHDHILFGWILFVLVVIFVMFCGRFLERIDDRTDAPSATAVRDPDLNDLSKTSVWAVAIALALVLSGSAFASLQLLSPTSAPTSAPTSGTTPGTTSGAAPAVAKVSLSEGLGQTAGWQVAATVPASVWSASLLGPDAQARMSYAKAERQVDVHVGYFASQRQGSEVVNQRHSVANLDAGWRRISLKVVADQLVITDALTVNEVRAQHEKSRENRLVWWWYWVDGEFTADPVRAKLLQLRSIFSGHRQAAIIVVSAAVSGTVDATRASMNEWLRESAKTIAVDLDSLGH